MTRFHSPGNRPFGLVPNLLSLVDIEPWMMALLWSGGDEPETITFLSWPNYGRNTFPYPLAVGDREGYSDFSKGSWIRIIRGPHDGRAMRRAEQVSVARLGLCTDILGDWDQSHCCTSISVSNS